MTFAEFEARLLACNARVYTLGQRADRRGHWYVNVYLPPKIPHPKVGTGFPEFSGHAFGPDLSTALERALACRVVHWRDKSRVVDLATGIEVHMTEPTNTGMGDIA
jgi:hypothetical protein